MEKPASKPDPTPTVIPPSVGDAYTEQDAAEPSGWNRRNWFITAYLEMLDREKS